jgi:hypothetical protein
VGTSPKTFRRSVYGAASLLLLGLLALSCSNEGDVSTGGETHFLTRCEPGSDSCGNLICLCGVCTLPCGERPACGAFSDAACIASAEAEACNDNPAPGHCDVPCVADRDCAVVSSSHRCVSGACRAGSLTSIGGGAGGSSAGSGSIGVSGGGDGGACTTGQVSGNQVLLIGDSFFASSHQITAYLEQLARDSGALALGERYRDNSSLTENALALVGHGIAGQYESGVAEAEVKLVIMNGGGADVFLGSCVTVDASCPAITAAASAARDLLAKMATDGVLEVVYAFYPDPIDAAVRAKMDILRPLIEDACVSSPVPCRWLDLRPTFAAHYADYVLADGLNPTAAGSDVSAKAIWGTMQKYCIAQ